MSGPSGESPPAQALPARAQAGVLTARYASCWLGDIPTAILLFAQAPLIGWLCTVVWGSVKGDTPSLYFVMCLSALWFGCINACREIVKERTIVERERFFGLSMSAYVASKIAVLSALCLAQVLGMQLVIEGSLAPRGPLPVQTLALLGSAICGVGLGLLVSALSSAQERAVGVVPLLIIPQILFSEVAIPRSAMNGTVEWVEKIMPVHWGFQVFQEVAAAEPDWLAASADLLVLPLYAAALAGLAALALVARRAEV